MFFPFFFFIIVQISQRLEEQHLKHVQIENELNELHRRKLNDIEEKYQQILANERQENETRTQTLLGKIEQMKIELEQLQTTNMAERQDLARKLQDVFESALFKGSNKSTVPSNDRSPPSLKSSQPIVLNRSQPSDTQAKGKKLVSLEKCSSLNDPEKEERTELFHPIPTINTDSTNLSAIRLLSSRIDSLVDQTTRVTNAFEIPSRSTFSSQPETNHEWTENPPK